MDRKNDFNFSITVLAVDSELKKAGRKYNFKFLSINEVFIYIHNIFAKLDENF